jgi:hypothetical protein
MIAAPPKAGDYPDRLIDCQAATEDALSKVLDDAIAAGWEMETTVAAVIELAENYGLKMIEIARVDAAVTAARGKPNG